VYQLGLIRMFIYFRQMSFLRHLGFLRQRLLHHVAQISTFSGKCRDMSRHLINFFNDSAQRSSAPPRTPALRNPQAIEVFEYKIIRSLDH
jgi:hypothetical protein